MPKYPRSGQAQLLRPNQQGFFFNGESVIAGQASQAFEIGRIQDAYPWGMSFQFAFSGNPGAFQYDVQTSDTDQANSYVTIASLTGGLNSSYQSRIELPQFWARYVRVNCVALAKRGDFNSCSDKMKMILFVFLLLSALAWAQGGGQVIVGNFGVQSVLSAPFGSCSHNAPLQMVVGAGTLYSCQSGTWAQISGTRSMTWPSTPGVPVCTGTPCTAWGTTLTLFNSEAGVATSATLGNWMIEMWPHPLSILPYTFSFLRRGPQLINPSDTVPFPLTEETVLWRAKSAAFSFKEAQKGENVERGSGADFKFLIEMAEAQHKLTLKPCKDKSRDLVELFFSRYRRDQFVTSEPYSNQDNV